MTTVHGVALYVDPDWEPPIITAIDQGPRALTVVRRCADVAELAAAGLSGVADIALISGDALDVDAHLCDELSSYGMKIVMLRPSGEGADGFPAGYYLSLGAHRVVDQHDIDAIITTLSSLIVDNPTPASQTSDTSEAATSDTQDGIDAEFAQIIEQGTAPAAQAPTDHAPERQASGLANPAPQDEALATDSSAPSGPSDPSSTDAALPSRLSKAAESSPVRAAGAAPSPSAEAPAEAAPAAPEPPSFPTQERRGFLRGLRRPRAAAPTPHGRNMSAAHADSPQAHAGQGGEPRGIVVAVFGTSGAPGRTTTAVHVAAELRRHGSAAVLDADVYAPSVAHSLGMAVDGSSVSALARMRGRGLLNSTLLHEAAYEGPGGIKVLTGLTSTHRWREASPTTMSAIVDACRRTWDYTVADVHASCGDPVDEYHRSVPHRDHVAAQVLGDADAVVVVVRGDVVGLHRFSETWEWLDLIGAPQHRIVAVNCAQVERAGRTPEQALAAALTHEIPGQHISLIPYDGQVLTALLHGRLTPVGGKRSARAAFADLAQRIVREVPSDRVASMTRRDGL